MAPGAKASLILGVIAFFTGLAPIGIFGLIKALKARKTIREAPGQYIGAPFATFPSLFGDRSSCSVEIRTLPDSAAGLWSTA